VIVGRGRVGEIRGVDLPGAVLHETELPPHLEVIRLLLGRVGHLEDDLADVLGHLDRRVVLGHPALALRLLAARRRNVRRRCVAAAESDRQAPHADHGDQHKEGRPALEPGAAAQRDTRTAPDALAAGGAEARLGQQRGAALRTESVGHSETAERYQLSVSEPTDPAARGLPLRGGDFGVKDRRVGPSVADVYIPPSMVWRLES
jgi:hypothetical protein